MSVFSGMFSKKLADLSRLGMDIHSHLIPGIDDGAKTVGQSIEMLNKFHEMGYTKLIMTPHIYPGIYNNTRETIETAFNLLKSQADLPEIELHFAAEYFFDVETIFEKIKKETLLLFEKNHLLFEFSFQHPPVEVAKLIFELRSKQIVPVLAHVERYGYLHKNLEQLEEIRYNGVKLQLNINSLSGHYGPEVQKQSEKLIDLGWISVAGSDCHKIEHLHLLERNLSKKYLHKLLDLNLMNYQWKV